MGIRIGIGGLKIGQGSTGVNWSSYWTTRLPYFALPATGVSLMVGQEVTIYGDALINVPIGNPLAVTYTCDIGTQVGNNLVITPEAGDVGNHSLRAVFKNGSYTIEDKTITISVNGVAAAGSAKIMLVGDSTMTGIAPTNIAARLSANLPDSTLTFVGTQGTTVLHEGYVGHTWNDMITEAPWVKTGSLDIAAYFTDNSIDVPDYMLIRLGLNDVFTASTITGDGLTDAELLAIINDAKTFIDAVLAHDAAINIIVALPTITENTGIGWDEDYDTSVYSIDMFIDAIHKLRKELSDEFANGTYNTRVDCSYESIFLDRDEGYPKTLGVHTNGLHPDESGYIQLGNGLSPSVNNLLSSKIAPSAVTVSWVDDYAKIDFTDNTGSVATHEIWESKDGGAYTLVTTLDAATVTYNNRTWQNATMKFRVRAKSGSWYSDFAESDTLITPLVWKTDQSTLTNVVINILNIAAGKTVNVNWGDGSNADYSGNNSNITKGYGEGNEQDPYYIQLSGDVDSIMRFEHYDQVLSYGDISKWCLPTALSNCNIKSNMFEGDISDWVLPDVITIFYIPTNALYENKVSGDLSGWVMPNVLTRFYIANQEITKLPRGSYVGLDATIGLYAPGCLLSQEEIDDFLDDVDDYFATTTPTKNMQIKINAVGNGIPSAAGLASKSAIEAKFIAAGFTATITVNS
jgi:lysophospholipase L1-like esterase